MTISAERETIWAAQPTHQLRILCLSDSDTRLKWTTAVADRLVQDLGRIRDGSPPTVTVASIDGGNTPSERQLAENEVVGPYLVPSDDEVAELVSSGFDVVVTCTIGSRLHRTIDAARQLASAELPRPVVVTGYAGLVYEKHVEGLLWRAGADVICCNSASDAQLFADVMRQLGLDADTVVRSGFGVIGATGAPKPATGRRPPRTVTFAVQPDVPANGRDRVYLLERLVSYARAHPGRNVVVKLRARPDEQTTHRERHHYEQLYERHVVDRPPNLSFEYGRMSDTLARTDLLLTVSSTAALEAIAAGVAAAVVTDVGVGESVGNHVFVGSGLLASMSDIDHDRIPTVSEDWCAQHGLATADDTSNISRRVATLVDRQHRDGWLPVPPGFVGEDRTPRLLQKVGTTTEQTPQARSLPRAAVAAMLNGRLRSAYRRLDRWAHR